MISIGISLIHRTCPLQSEPAEGLCVKEGAFQVTAALFPQTDWDVWKVSMFPLIINFTLLAESLFYGKKIEAGEGYSI